MNRRNVLNSKALKKRFCTDTNMPITVFAEPYFLERLRALDYFYGGISKFNTFCYMLESDLFSTEQDYFEYYNSVKDRAINHIKAHEEFIKFENKVIPVPQIRLFSKTELYKPENDGKVFISIDLKKANFSIMKEHCSNLSAEHGKISLVVLQILISLKTASISGKLFLALAIQADKSNLKP